MARLFSIVTMLAIVSAVTIESVAYAYTDPYDRASYANVHASERSKRNFREIRRRTQEEQQENLGDTLAELLTAGEGDVEPTLLNKHETLSTSAAKDRNANMRELMNNLPLYSSDIEPPNAVVKFKMSFINVLYQNYSGIGIAGVWEQITWKDSRLSWKPEDFGGISSLRLQTWNIWIPDLTLYNSLGYTERSRDQVLLSADGTVLWITRAVYRVFCTTDYNAREVSCGYKVGSWVYDGNTVGLGLYGSEKTANGEWAAESIDTSDFDETCGATLVSARARIRDAYYDCCPNEPYPVYEAQVTFIPRGW